MSKSTSKLGSFVLIAIVILVFAFLYIWQRESVSTTFSGSHEVALSINPENTTETQIMLDVNGTSQVFGVFDDVYSRHYHPAEFVEGNLYVIRRVGDTDTENWIDQLWKYQTQDNGVMLYEGQGLDFRVAPDGHVVSVFTGSSPDEVVILDPNGEAVQIRLTKEFLELNPDYSLSYLSMTNEDLWLSETQGVKRMNVIGYNFDSAEISRWNISDVPVGIHESDFNPERLLVVFSDYQFAFDQDTEEGLKDTSVSLYVYYLEDESKRLLVTSPKRHEFNPKWIGDKEIEFNALDGSGRDQISIE